MKYLILDNNSIINTKNTNNFKILLYMIGE